MRTYENIFIIHPEIIGDAYQELLDKYKEVLNQHKSTLHKVEEWGIKTLAYPVKKQVKGNFVLLIFDASPEGLGELERRFRLDEAVIKFQTVLLEKFDPSTLEVATPSAEAEAIPEGEGAGGASTEKKEEVTEKTAEQSEEN